MGSRTLLNFQEKCNLAVRDPEQGDLEILLLMITLQDSDWLVRLARMGRGEFYLALIYLRAEARLLEDREEGIEILSTLDYMQRILEQGWTEDLEKETYQKDTL